VFSLSGDPPLDSCTPGTSDDSRPDGCSGSSGAEALRASPESNIKIPMASTGSTARGWSLNENAEGQDIWTGPNGLALVIEIDSDNPYSSAQEWATDQYGSLSVTAPSTGEVMVFEPESLGSNGAWWWGWNYGGDLFEGYLLQGSTGVNPELQGNETPLSKASAAEIMKTFALGE
jgi:hypothetical protein